MMKQIVTSKLIIGYSVAITALSLIVVYSVYIYTDPGETLTGKGSGVASFVIPSIVLAVFIIVFSLFIITNDSKKKQKLIKIQSALLKLSEAAHNSTTMDEFYRSIHQVLRGLLCANNLYIALYNAGSDTLGFPYFVDESGEKPSDRKPGNGLTEYVLKIRKPLYMNAEQKKEFMAKENITAYEKPSLSWFGVPIENKEEVIGAIVIQNYNAMNRISEEEFKIMNFVSEQVAMAIERKNYEERTRILIKELEIRNSEIGQNSRELTELNRKLTESGKKLAELNAGKDKYFSILSHDLKTPFNSLLGFTNILLDDFDELSLESIKKYVGIISGSTKNLFNLIENLFHWSMLQRNKHEFLPEVVKLSGQINYIYDLLKGNAVKKNITLKNNVDSEISFSADMNMLHSMLLNIITNSIKYTPNGGIISVGAEIKNNCVEISIADTGVGIKKEDISKLFLIEKSFSTKGTENEQGTGLGLILVKEMAEKQSAKIRIESEENKGTTFFVSFPEKV